MSANQITVQIVQHVVVQIGALGNRHTAEAKQHARAQDTEEDEQRGDEDAKKDREGKDCVGLITLSGSHLVGADNLTAD